MRNESGRPIFLPALGLTVVVVSVARPAMAYVDPGVVGMLFQAVFAMVFGFLVVFFTRPIQAVRRFWDRLRGHVPEEAEESGSSAAEEPAEDEAHPGGDAG